MAGVEMHYQKWTVTKNLHSKTKLEISNGKIVLENCKKLTMLAYVLKDQILYVFIYPYMIIDDETPWGPILSTTLL